MKRIGKRNTCIYIYDLTLQGFGGTYQQQNRSVCCNLQHNFCKKINANTVVLLQLSTRPKKKKYKLKINVQCMRQSSNVEPYIIFYRMKISSLNARTCLPQLAQSLNCNSHSSGFSYRLTRHVPRAPNLQGVALGSKFLIKI